METDENPGCGVIFLNSSVITGVQPSGRCVFVVISVSGRPQGQRVPLHLVCGPPSQLDLCNLNAGVEGCHRLPAG